VEKRGDKGVEAERRENRLFFMPSASNSTIEKRRGEKNEERREK
jgi:hypothetical protein